MLPISRLVEQSRYVDKTRWAKYGEAVPRLQAIFGFDQVKRLSAGHGYYQNIYKINSTPYLKPAYHGFTSLQRDFPQRIIE